MGGWAAKQNEEEVELSIVERGYIDNLPPPVPPEQQIADLFNEHRRTRRAVILSNITILQGTMTAPLDPEDVRSFLATHWPKVSKLAHQIHGEVSGKP